MPIFDHAECPSCRARLDPESIAPAADGFRCPACGAQLGIGSLFGVADAWAEEEEPVPTLDELVPGAPAPGPPSDAPPPEGGALELLRRIRRDRNGS